MKPCHGRIRASERLSASSGQGFGVGSTESQIYTLPEASTWYSDDSTGIQSFSQRAGIPAAWLPLPSFIRTIPSATELHRAHARLPHPGPLLKEREEDTLTRGLFDKSRITADRELGLLPHPAPKEYSVATILRAHWARVKNGCLGILVVWCSGEAPRSTRTPNHQATESPEHQATESPPQPARRLQPADQARE